MNIHQVYFDDSQRVNLNNEFIPFRNIPNMETPYPQFYEYPIFKFLQNKYEEEKYNGLWGYVSWRFQQKLQRFYPNLTPADYCQWIIDNPGYDFYHMNVVWRETELFDNIFFQGEKCHPGLLGFFTRLVHLKGWDFDLHKKYDPEYSLTCHYYVMNTKTWRQWLSFLDDTFEFVKSDAQLYNYANRESRHRNSPWYNWAFIAERIITIWIHLNPQVKFLAYK